MFMRKKHGRPVLFLLRHIIRVLACIWIYSPCLLAIKNHALKVYFAAKQALFSRIKTDVEKL